MGKIKLDSRFVDTEGKTLDSYKECCVVSDKGVFAKNTDGSTLIKVVPTPDEAFSLCDVCIKSLLAEFPSETPVDPEEKYDKYKLFCKFDEAKQKNSKTITLEAKEITLARKWVGKYANTLVMGQAFDMLEE